MSKPESIVILSEVSRSFTARDAVEGPSVRPQHRKQYTRILTPNLFDPSF
jgi:hypothetical protein